MSRDLIRRLGRLEADANKADGVAVIPIHYGATEQDREAAIANWRSGNQGRPEPDLVVFMLRFGDSFLQAIRPSHA